MKVDVLAVMPHYGAHIRPVWDALPEEIRGHWYDREPLVPESDTVIVASYTDHVHARHAGYRQIVVMEHGIGQSYGDLNPSYPGGRNREADLYLAPNHHAAARWRMMYPRTPVVVIGSPRIEGLPARADGPLTVAVSFHWDCRIAPESRTAFPHYRSALPILAEQFNVIGHAHPRANMRGAYRSIGVPWVPDFDEVCRTADVYVCDNSSSMFEFASTGRPVVVLNAPWYRRSVDHGLRFWEAAPVGANVDYADQLVRAVERALDDDPIYADARAAAVDLVYPVRNGVALAVDAIRDLAAVPV